MLLAIDKSGVLNAFSSIAGAPDVFQGPELIGAAALVPGSPVSACALSSTVLALTIDARGVMNIASFSPSAGWSSLDTLGDACYVPGSHIAVFGVSPTSCAALVIDSNGVVNSALFDASTGWQPFTSVGQPIFVPGGPISVSQLDSNTHLIGIIDRFGMLNVLLFDLVTGLTEPIGYGTASFPAGAASSGCDQ